MYMYMPLKLCVHSWDRMQCLRVISMTYVMWRSVACSKKLSKGFAYSRVVPNQIYISEVIGVTGMNLSRDCHQYDIIHVPSVFCWRSSTYHLINPTTTTSNVAMVAPGSVWNIMHSHGDWDKGVSSNTHNVQHSQRLVVTDGWPSGTEDWQSMSL